MYSIWKKLVQSYDEEIVSSHEESYEPQASLSSHGQVLDYRDRDFGEILVYLSVSSIPPESLLIRHRSGLFSLDRLFVEVPFDHREFTLVVP